MSPVFTARGALGKPAAFTVTEKIATRADLSVELTARRQDGGVFIGMIPVSSADFERLEPGQEVRVKLETPRKGAK